MRLIAFFSAVIACAILGLFNNIFNLKLFAFLAYATLYEGSSSVLSFGNSFFNIARAAPSEAIIGSKPSLIRALIIGIQRVA